MPGYRFCRTDDLPLLVEACRRCGEPPFAGGEPLTAQLLNRWMREWRLWCSSCMVAFEDDVPVGVLLATKASEASSILWIAVHPEHRRRGHARHMLRSLQQKLAILGPPRIYAEVPSRHDAGRRLFETVGFQLLAELSDYVVRASRDTPGLEAMATGVTPAELLEAGVRLGGHSPAPRAWWRREDTVERAAPRLEGLAVACGDRLEAWLLMERLERPGGTARAPAAGCAGDEDAARLLGLLLRHAAYRSGGTLELPRLRAGELPPQALETARAQVSASYLLLAAEARRASS